MTSNQLRQAMTTIAHNSNISAAGISKAMLHSQAVASKHYLSVHNSAVDGKLSKSFYVLN